MCCPVLSALEPQPFEIGAGTINFGERTGEELSSPLLKLLLVCCPLLEEQPSQPIVFPAVALANLAGFRLHFLIVDVLCCRVYVALGQQ
jgi:hypothetical protein